LLDLWKMGVERPALVIDISRLPLNGIEWLPDQKGLRIGALSRNADVAEHALVKTHFPLLTQALLAGASPQLRNAATVGGNLLKVTGEATYASEFRLPGHVLCPAHPEHNRGRYGSFHRSGIGMALMEATVPDLNTGRVANANLAEYQVPVSTDSPPEFVIEFTDVPDLNFNSLGARGVGEIGIVGTPAALANAVFHATGKRDLPIMPDKRL
jgi:CO/xanthine dehydrogenase FAD-binding subunit